MVFPAGMLPGGRGRSGTGGRLVLWSSALLALLCVAAALCVWVWFFCRIEPREGQMAVLIRKTGRALEPGSIIAAAPGAKGIQLEVLPEGRYFLNPYTWSWRIHGLTDIPSGKLGVQVRLFGRDLDSGKLLAGPDEKGIVPEILRPGRYRINPYAYRVQIFDAINIRPGHVGVLTWLVGDDVLSGNPKSINTFLVGEGEKGVHKEVIDPGTYYLNPYMVSVTEVDLRSHRFEMSGEDAISFLSMDGFDVFVEGTIEWSIDRDQAALITHRVGDVEDILRKIILPHARGFSRIEGSKKPAVEYILGETRKQFQDNLFENLRRTCAERGITIRSTLIRNIRPPERIATIKRDREVAVQDRNKYELQIEEATSRAELARQEMLAEQNSRKVEQETAKIRAVIQAEEAKAVALTDAGRELDVARLDNEAADFQAGAILEGARAEESVINFNNAATFEVLSHNVKAFGSGSAYARYVYLTGIAPRIGSVLASEEGALGDVFRALGEGGFGSRGGAK